MRGYFVMSPPTFVLFKLYLRFIKVDLTQKFISFDYVSTFTACLNKSLSRKIPTVIPCNNLMEVVPIKIRKSVA